MNTSFVHELKEYVKMLVHKIMHDKPLGMFCHYTSKVYQKLQMSDVFTRHLNEGWKFSYILTSISRSK